MLWRRNKDDALELRSNTGALVGATWLTGSGWATSLYRPIELGVGPEGLLSAHRGRNFKTKQEAMAAVRTQFLPEC